MTKFETQSQAKWCCHKSFEKVIKSRYFDIESGKYIPCYTVVMK